MIYRVLVLTFILTPGRAQDVSQWFEFKRSQAAQNNVTDISGWLDKPAGKHGFLKMNGKDYTFEDGTKIKFWGVNICSDEPFSEKQKVDEWVPFITRHGINGVRFHKFTWDAHDGVHSTQLSNEKWSRFDYFCHALREAGVYYSWSHIYGHRVLRSDSARMLAYREIKDTKFPWSHLNGTTASLVNFAEDLQAINIELTVNMLNHVNPHTGKRYAEDPALSFIELQNEDNIFWGAIEETLKQTPTYKKLLCTKFSRWLKSKYGNTENLREAWGNLGLSPDESVENENIYPHPNHGIFSYEYEKAVQARQDVPRYIADRAAFLFDEQRAFYTKFVMAIRATGYRGVIVGSCWQAGSGITHFYNLFTDYEAGAIDRHNYFGGGSGHQLKPGPFNNTAMVSSPGSGLLSTGFQMVADRPFQISEWMSLVPTEWIAESAPIIAAYGMGLQGWDASYSFAMDLTHYTNTLQSVHGIYNVTSPLHLSLYPALATMIYRGDVQEGKVAANRNVTLDNLRNGKLSFIEKTSQQYDIKSFQSTVPTGALAVGPVTMSFDEAGKTFSLDMKNLWDEEKKVIRSNTGQLAWHYGKQSFFTVNTPGTKAVVGFLPNRMIELGEVSIESSNTFAVIFFSSLDPGKDIKSAKRILLTTLARGQNTGMQYDQEKKNLLQVGDPPLLLEPVDLTISFKGKGTPKIEVLDHAGNRTGKLLQQDGKQFRIKGSETKSFYYELTF